MNESFAQVAAWVVYKKAATTQDLILPLGLFVAHLALGGIWNGACAYFCFTVPSNASVERSKNLTTGVD